MHREYPVQQERCAAPTYLSAEPRHTLASVVSSPPKYVYTSNSVLHLSSYYPQGSGHADYSSRKHAFALSVPPTFVAHRTAAAALSLSLPSE